MKALEGGFDVNLFSLFILFYFGLIARTRRVGMRSSERDFFWVNCVNKVRVKALE